MANIVKISGPVVEAEGMKDAKMYDVVRVGEEGLIGEVIRLAGGRVAIQVYEDTAGIRPGEKVATTGTPLSVELGPGLATSIFDGIQRPLPVIQERSGDIIKRGVVAEALDKKKKWRFVPSLKRGASVEGGDVVGTVQETQSTQHRILVPVGVSGEIGEIQEGEFTLEEPVYSLKSSGKARGLPMLQRWEVRKPRPYKQKLQPNRPLITGQRTVDVFFPVARGGSACIPGPFGSGKCVLPDTPVLLADGTLIPIEQIYRDALTSDSEARQETEGLEEQVIPAKDLRVLSFDGTRFIPKTVSHVYKGKTSNIVRLKTSSGKGIGVTPSHKLVRFNTNGTFCECPAGALAVGDYIAVPRKIPVPESRYQKVDSYALSDTRVLDAGVLMSVRRTICDAARMRGSLKALSKTLGVPYATIINYSLGRNRPTVKFVAALYRYANLERPEIALVKPERHGVALRIPARVDEDLAEFLGLLFSDGMVAGREVRFFNKDRLLRDRFSALARSLFGLAGVAKRFNTVDGIAIRSTALIGLLKHFGLPARKKSQNVQVPLQVTRSPESVIAAFVRGYYLGDGSFAFRVVEFSSESAKLIEGLSYALGRLGILYSILGGKREGHRLIISSQRQLIKFASCVFPEGTECSEVEKVSSIRGYAARVLGKSQTRDIVPLDADLLRRLFSPTGVYNYAHEERLGAYKFSQLMKGAPPGAVSLLGGLEEALEWVAVERVESIEIQTGERVVYDLTVPETHNFIGGHVPMILHNTVTQQQLAKWADADMIVYVGCGERGNEMTEVLTTFPELEDPRTKRPLMERTVLIANTSNMPVAAREASIYTGITIAEYYRDMGYAVALLADSTSRWAEALREISGRLEEMPGEEGYPAYLGRRLAEFYERAGSVVTLGKEPREGSVTVIGAVSPPGGDISEPVSQNTLRVTRAFWGLDASLASRRHFPSINWLTSYSLYKDVLAEWYAKNVSTDFLEMQGRAMLVLQQEAELQEIVQLVGPDALPERERAILDAARMIREDFLQQSAYHDVDTYTSLKKDRLMLKAILGFYELELHAVESGIPLARILSLAVRNKIGRMKEVPENVSEGELNGIMQETETEFKALEAGMQVAGTTQGVR